MKASSVVILPFLCVWSAIGQPAMDTAFTRVVGPGCVLKKLVAPSTPMTAYVLKVDLTHPSLSLETVKAQDRLVGTEQTSSMAARTVFENHRVVAAVNGDYYTTTSPSIGLPLSIQIRKGEMLRTPSVHAVLGFDTANAAMIGIVTFAGSVTHTQATRSVDGVNQTRGSDQLILFNSYFGASTGTDAGGAEVVVHPAESWIVNGAVHCIVENVLDGTGNSALAPGKAILSGNGTARDFLIAQLSPGDTVTVTMTVTPALPQIREMIGGWPKIVLNGLDYVDQGYADEGGPPGSGSNTQPNPRTAAGFTADGKTLFLVAVDGRQPSLSTGMTVHELAGFLIGLGVYTGINLDGGGSTTMLIDGSVINSPSDGTERAVGNCLTVVSQDIPEAWVCPTGICGQPGFTFDSIQTAVRYLAPGGTLHLAPATYVESVTLTRDLVLTSPGVPTILNLAVNGAAITLGANVQISGTLTLTGGRITTGPNKVVVTNNAPGAVVLSNGTVRGEVQRTIAAGSTGTYAFTEVHTGITPDGSQPVTNFSLRSFPGVYPPGAPSSGAVNRYYVINSVGAALTATLSLAYEHAELNSIPEKNLMLFSSSDGTAWVERGGTVNSADNYVQLSTVSDWSTWTMGDADNPLPIQLAFFECVMVQGIGVRLSWGTMSEVNCYGFEVQKSQDEILPYTTISGSFIQGHGTTTLPQGYSLVDTCAAAGTWFYRIVQLDLDGRRHYSDGIRVEVPTDVSAREIPESYALLQNYPNPFNPTTAVSFQLPVTSDVKLAVYDLLGREVAVLVNERKKRGSYVITFYAGNLPSGTYFCTIDAHPQRGGGYRSVRRLLVLK